MERNAKINGLFSDVLQIVEKNVLGVTTLCPQCHSHMPDLFDDIKGQITRLQKTYSEEASSSAKKRKVGGKIPSTPTSIRTVSSGEVARSLPDVSRVQSKLDNQKAQTSPPGRKTTGIKVKESPTRRDRSPPILIDVSSDTSPAAIDRHPPVIKRFNGGSPGHQKRSSPRRATFPSTVHSALL